MSILMDALKQQVEPAPVSAGAQAGNGWRNLALLFGFCLAMLLGFGLASWLQSNNAPADVTATIANQPPPVLADSGSIVAALLSASAETEADLAAEPVAAVSRQPQQEQLQPEPKVVSVTAQQQPASSQLDQPGVVGSEPEVEVSAELRQRFASAMAASELGQRQPAVASRSNGAPAQDISELAAALQRQIPSLRFEAHVYATQSQQRWIKVNGKSLQEGQWVTADIRLKEITPQFVLLEMGSELFSMAALADYK